MRLQEIKKSASPKSQFFTTREDVENWLHEMGIDRYTINNDLTVDVPDDVSLENHGFQYFPVRFGRVDGYFDCSDCQDLRSLVGAPESVGTWFGCEHCKSLTSFEGAPAGMVQKFYANGCTTLTSLKGSPREVHGSFHVYDCKSLATLEGAPDVVLGEFDITGCSLLTSLTGIPKQIKGTLSFLECPNIKNYLQILRIKGLTRVSASKTKASRIINKYLPEGDIFECQQELMDAGLEEFAEL